MRPFTFHPGPRLLSGEGCAAALADQLPTGPCLFVTDRDVVAFGLTDACRAALEGGGREIVLTGSLKQGTFVGEPETLITKCPSKFTTESDA